MCSAGPHPLVPSRLNPPTQAKICAQLDGALLTDDEMAKYLERWAATPDPPHPEVHCQRGCGCARLLACGRPAGQAPNAARAVAYAFRVVSLCCVAAAPPYVGGDVARGQAAQGRGGGQGGGGGPPPPPPPPPRARAAVH